MSLVGGQVARLRTLRTANFPHSCRLTLPVPPGVDAVTQTLPCEVSRSGGQFGYRAGYGGGAPPMDRQHDVTIFFPYGTQLESAASVDWIDGELSYTIGAVPKLSSAEVDSRADAVEVSS